MPIWLDLVQTTSVRRVVCPYLQYQALFGVAAVHGARHPSLCHTHRRDDFAIRVVNDRGREALDVLRRQRKACRLFDLLRCIQ